MQGLLLLQSCGINCSPGQTAGNPCKCNKSASQAVAAPGPGDVQGGFGGGRAGRDEGICVRREFATSPAGAIALLLYGPAAGAFSGPGLCLNVWGLTVKMTAPGTLQASGISTRAYGSFSIFRCGLGSGSDFAVSGALVYFFFRNLAAGVGLSILRLFRLGPAGVFHISGSRLRIFGFWGCCFRFCAVSFAAVPAGSAAAPGPEAFKAAPAAGGSPLLQAAMQVVPAGALRSGAAGARRVMRAARL